MRRLPLGFLIIVGLPTLVGALYYGVIASPRYVSESHFVVRSAGSAQPSGLGLALQGVGLSAGMNDYVPKPVQMGTLAAVLQRWSG